MNVSLLGPLGYASSDECPDFQGSPALSHNGIESDLHTTLAASSPAFLTAHPDALLRP